MLDSSFLEKAKNQFGGGNAMSLTYSALILGAARVSDQHNI